MSLRYKKKLNASSAFSVGWLFADLLLALAMLFLIANTVTTPVMTKVKPTPTKVVIKPTPTQLPRLKLQSHRFTLTIDVGGLLNGTQATIDDVKQQVRAIKFLQGHSVGLVIAYGGAPTSTDIDIGNAQAIAARMYDTLKKLGQEKFAFDHASYYDNLYVLGASSSQVTLDIYLFAE